MLGLFIYTAVLFLAYGFFFQNDGICHVGELTTQGYQLTEILLSYSSKQKNLIIMEKFWRDHFIIK